MIKSMIARLRGNTPSFGPVNPDSPFFAVGDVHGRVDLLISLLRQLDPGLPVIFVGDYVDRGENSAEVLRVLRGRPGALALKGNHEEMLLSFLDNPESRGAHWLRNGGLQTLASYGIAGLTDTSDGEELTRARDALVAAMGPELINWLRVRPLCYRSGNVAVVHAGADPGTAIEDQSDAHLLWGHPEFSRKPRLDGMWIVHGHRIVDTPKAENGVISIDTGAYATGRLTAALIASDGVDFITG